MPGPALPPDALREGPAERAAERAAETRAHEPLFEVDTVGERLALVAMLVLIVGALMPWGAEKYVIWGPLGLSDLDLIPLVMGVLTLLQVLSTASKVSNVVMLGVTAFASLAAVGARVADGFVSHQPIGAGLPILLLGIALGLGAMDVQRREARLNYVAMASRALDLALQPRVQIALLKLLIPFALAGLMVFVVLEAFGEAVANKLAGVFVLYFFNPVGKEVGIPFALSGAFPPAIDPGLTWMFIFTIDVCTAMFFVWNYDHVLRVPYIGRFLAWVERRGNAAVVKRKWIGRLAFFGLAIYATLPLEGTGAIGGSVVGRAIGLPAAKTFLAVAAGSVVRTTATILVVLGALSALGL